MSYLRIPDGSGQQIVSWHIVTDGQILNLSTLWVADHIVRINIGANLAIHILVHARMADHNIAQTNVLVGKINLCKNKIK
jgi:hypothetical protein